jgi:hypothetical protein
MRNDKSASGWDRRDFFQVAAAAGLLATAPRAASAVQPSETEADVSQQPTPMPGADMMTSDILAETTGVQLTYSGLSAMASTRSSSP